MRFCIVLEGLPASGKTTLANSLRDNHGFIKINESLGHLSEKNLTDDQVKIFNETLEKYSLAKEADGMVIIDRGYPSMLAWDYCAQELGYAQDLEEKEKNVGEALNKGYIFEPDLYVYLVSKPEDSLNRRPRETTKIDVWSGTEGMLHCKEYYERFFAEKQNCLKIDATEQTEEMISKITGYITNK